MGKRTTRAVMIIALMILSVLPFLPGIDAPFFYDDFNTIVTNPAIRSPDLVSYFTHPETFAADRSRMFRPLTTASLALNYQWFGGRIQGWHLTNLFAHILCVAMVFLVVDSLLGSTFLAFLTALWFGIHPSRVVPVVYISARSEIFASFFYLLSFYLFLLMRRSAQKYAGILAGILSLACFWLGLTCKDIAITLPATLTLAVLVFQKPERKTLFWLALFWLSVPIYFLVRHRLNLYSFFPAARPRPVFENLLLQARVVVYYIRWLFFPMHPSVEAQFSPLSTSVAALCAILLAAVLAIGVFLVFKRRAAGFFICFFFIVLSPSSSLVPLVVEGSISRAYLAGLSCFVLFAWLLLQVDAQGRNRITAMILAAVISICLFVFSIDWAGDWKNPGRLWSRTVMVFPRHSPGHDNLGLWLERNGNFPQAEREYVLALISDPENATALDNYGRMLYRKDEFELAEQFFKKSLELKPWNCIARINYGQMLVSLGRVNEAREIVGAIDFCPGYEQEFEELKRRAGNSPTP